MKLTGSLSWLPSFRWNFPLTEVYNCEMILQFLPFHILFTLSVVSQNHCSSHHSPDIFLFHIFCVTWTCKAAYQFFSKTQIPKPFQIQFSYLSLCGYLSAISHNKNKTKTSVEFSITYWKPTTWSYSGTEVDLPWAPYPLCHAPSSMWHWDSVVLP